MLPIYFIYKQNNFNICIITYFKFFKYFMSFQFLFNQYFVLKYLLTFSDISQYMRKIKLSYIRINRYFYFLC